MLNYSQVIRSAAQAFGSRVAIEDTSVSYTYDDVDRVTLQLASGLRSLGLTPGDAVIWLSPNTATHLLAHWATARAGLRFSPLNYYLRASELQAAIELVRPRLVLAHADYLETLDPLCDELGIEHRFVVDSDQPVGTWSSWRDLLDADATADLEIDGLEDLQHEIIFTSGTTGQVKGVARTQRQRILEATVSLIVNPLIAESQVMRGSPQFHVGGSTGPIQTLIQGGRSVIYKFTPAGLVERIKAGGTHISGVPAQYSMLFDSGLLDGVDTSGVRHCKIAGNGAAPSQFLAIQRAFPNAVLAHGYGSTESGMATFTCGDEFMAHLGSIGRVAPGVEVKVVDDAGAEVETGQVGEILVRSELLMTEYIGRPDLTGEAFTADGFLRMGDLGRCDAEGFFYIVGRKKDMIITGGENVYPKEVEDVISALEFVAEAAVVGAPDPTYEERVVAVVRLHERAAGDREEMIAEITDTVREKLAGYKSPKNVLFVTDYPRNALGKIDKVALRKQHETIATGI